MELILAIVAAGPMGLLASTPNRGLVLYLAAWALVFPIQTVVVFSDGNGEASYWLVNAAILAGGVCLNRFGARLRRRRRAVLGNSGGVS
jgi:hypothetical protein